VTEWKKTLLKEVGEIFPREKAGMELLLKIGDTPNLKILKGKFDSKEMC